MVRNGRRIVFTVALSAKEYWFMLWEELNSLQWVYN